MVASGSWVARQVMVRHVIVKPACQSTVFESQSRAGLTGRSATTQLGASIVPIAASMTNASANEQPGRAREIEGDP